MSSQPSVLDLIEARRPRHTLSRELYCDPEVYRQDLDQIWHREWIFIGHSFEIPRPGQYLTAQIGDYPVVVVRDDDGRVRAFHNVCRHRGSRLCTDRQGRVAKLVCPYHRWTYGLDGKLLFAASMGEAFDSRAHGLLPAHCETLDSHIFVCVAGQAPDFQAFRSAASPFLAPHGLEGCKVAFETDMVEKGNWKLVFENNRECYHCDANHPELIKSFVENLAVAGVGGGEDPALAAFWDRCEAAGLPSRLAMAPDGQYRMTRIPLAGKAVSYTLDGRAAVNRRLDGAGVENIGALLYFHYPSTWNHYLGDHALSFRVLPLGPGETLVTTKWLVPADAVEGRDYDVENLTRVWRATNEQDRALVEETFRGASSPTYVPGPYSDLLENGVCQFVDWYCDTLRRRLAG